MMMMHDRQAATANEINQTWAVSVVEPIQQELEDNFGLKPSHPPTLLATNIITSKSKPSTWSSLLHIALWLVGLLTLAAVATLLCRQYLGSLLVFLERLPGPVGPMLFIAAYVAVSFPFMMGVVVLNLAAGYLYGLLDGVLICVIGGTVGAFIATAACRHCFKSTVQRLQNSYTNLKQISRVIEGEQGFRIICMARLTFVPFGLQNALFAASKISRRGYILATAAGLLPMTLMNVYIGTTVRSMEAVMEGDWSNHTHSMVVVVGQLVVASVVTIYVSQRMKREVLAACRDGTLPKRQLGHNRNSTMDFSTVGSFQDDLSPATSQDSQLAPLPLLPPGDHSRSHRRSQSAGAALVQLAMQA
eukprot:TRINITY_DN9247_c0_g1_i3.p1 TRINITY_DN9247_c0_g1~~TRINITY_DN9247_c0_g1_i3.p1  ORF type:complete len:360 (+),score=46.22 TRINITY_DN9247_c0_g1_i3:284-1363(+)